MISEQRIAELAVEAVNTAFGSAEPAGFLMDAIRTALKEADETAPEVLRDAERWRRIEGELRPTDKYFGWCVREWAMSSSCDHNSIRSVVDALLAKKG